MQNALHELRYERQRRELEALPLRRGSARRQTRCPEATGERFSLAGRNQGHVHGLCLSFIDMYGTPTIFITNEVGIHPRVSIEIFPCEYFVVSWRQPFHLKTAGGV